MKLRALFAGISLLAVSASLAQVPAPPGPKPSPAAPAAPVITDETVTPPAPKTPAPKKDDAKAKAKAAAAKKAPATAKKADEPPATVDGLAITRAKGGFLGLQVVNNNFVLTFYNAKKAKVAPDVARATVRWPVNYQPGPERTVLNPGGAFSLTSSKVVKPPRNFKVFISVFLEGSEEAVESLTADYRGQ